MSYKRLILKEIDSIPEERLGELHELVKDFARTTGDGTKEGIMAKLRRIRISGPRDFAKNVDSYLKREAGG